VATAPIDLGKVSDPAKLDTDELLALLAEVADDLTATLEF